MIQVRCTFRREFQTYKYLEKSQLYECVLNVVLCHSQHLK